MKALVAKLKLCSLYSIRIPFTWQSALTYPVLPPSAIIGLIANALQRYKNGKHPLDYLGQIENKIIWAGSRLLTPCVIKSYITSAIVKWEDTLGGKFTNALGRQFAFTRDIEIAAIFKEDTLLEDVVTALKTTPLTCGDSESPVFVEKVMVKEVYENVTEKEFETLYPIPFTKETEVLSGKGQIFLIHERCLKTGETFPLVCYLVPVEERKGIIHPAYLRVKLSNEKALKIQDIGYIVLRNQTLEEKTKKSKRKK